MSFWKWSKTAANNDVADPTTNWRENQAPSTVNDASRSMMAALAKWRDDISGTLVTAGTSTAYTVTTNQIITTRTGHSPMLAIIPHVTSGASPTLNEDSQGALPIRGETGVALDAGVLIAGTPYVVVLNAAKTEFLLHGYYTQPTSVPIGVMLPYVGSAAPSSLYALPYGQAVSRTTYATLFALSGTSFGAGDGSTTFNLPDIRGRTIFGQDNMGGTAANRITNAGSGIVGTTRGATGGAQNASISQANLPNYTLPDTFSISAGSSHSHLVSARAGALAGSNGVPISSDGGGSLVTASSGTESSHTHPLTGSVTSGGSGTAFNKMPPAVISPFILRVI